MAAKSYRVTFERLGRRSAPLAFTIRAHDADEAARIIHRHAKDRLLSREVEVIVDLEAGKGRVIVGGFRPVGDFTVTEVTEARYAGDGAAT